MREVPLYLTTHPHAWTNLSFSSKVPLCTKVRDFFSRGQAIRCKGIQRHPNVGSSWPSWPKASQRTTTVTSKALNQADPTQ